MQTESLRRSSTAGTLTLAVALFVSSAWPAFCETAEKPAQALDGTPFFVAISVSDVEASSAWYQRVLGFEPSRAVDLEQRGLRIRILRRDNALLELTESVTARSMAQLDPPVEKRYLLHGVFKFGFLVDDLDQVAKDLERLEVPLRSRIVEEPDGTLRSLQVEDPDGNVVQVFERWGER